MVFSPRCVVMISLSNHGWTQWCRYHRLTFIYRNWCHYSDVIKIAAASKIACVSIVCGTVCSGADQRKYQSLASLAFVRGIHRRPLGSPHKGSVTRQMFPIDDVIMVDALTPTGSRWDPAQRISNAANVSTWWRHHGGCIDTSKTRKRTPMLHMTSLFRPT